MSPRSQLLLAAGALSALLPIMAQTHPSKTQSVKTRHAENQQEQSRGERVFNQNCARCHEAPQSFPPQVAGTILRHMRVRASLSAQDEKAVMEFMNP